jgi:hypothetical protein
MRASSPIGDFTGYMGKYYPEMFSPGPSIQILLRAINRKIPRARPIEQPEAVFWVVG